MHELGIVFHIIRTVEDVAKQNDVSRIRRVTLQLGEVSGVVESYLQDCKCAAQTVRRNCIFLWATDECNPVVSVAPQMRNCDLPSHRVVGIDPTKLVGEIRRTYNNVGQFRMRQTRSHIL